MTYAGGHYVWLAYSRTSVTLTSAILGAGERNSFRVAGEFNFGKSSTKNAARAGRTRPEMNLKGSIRWRFFLTIALYRNYQRDTEVEQNANRVEYVSLVSS